MELKFAFLCDSADMTAAGNLFAVGIDFDQILVEAVPAIGNISVVAKVTADPNEVSDSHTISISLTKPGQDRKEIVGQAPIQLSKNKIHPDRPSNAVVMIKVAVAFEALGDYVWHIALNGEEVKSLSLEVRQVDNVSKHARARAAEDVVQ
jgi:hypothetical protein